ncbi:MAG: carboxylating nicotinate-nucleotide diphosphorylase [Nitrospinaceae bacterium]
MKSQNYYNRSAVQPAAEDIERWVTLSLEEDLGPGDVTTGSILREDAPGRAVVTAKEPLVLCGLDCFKAVFLKLDAAAVFPGSARRDGDALQTGDTLVEVEARASALLQGERTALNMVQRLSGIATLTRTFADRAAPVTLLDTRKTTPGLRVFEKYAVRCGGGTNHRFGLFDAILIKDNHIRIAGSLTEAVRRAGKDSPPFIEVETSTLQEVEEAIHCGVDRILLDNMTLPQIVDAVQRVRGRTQIEVSGNITLQRLDELRGTGIDFVSVGALTHSARAVDISMNLAASG